MASFVYFRQVEYSVMQRSDSKRLRPGGFQCRAQIRTPTKASIELREGKRSKFLEIGKANWLRVSLWPHLKSWAQATLSHLQTVGFSAAQTWLSNCTPTISMRCSHRQKRTVY